MESIYLYQIGISLMEYPNGEVASYYGRKIRSALRAMVPRYIQGYLLARFRLATRRSCPRSVIYSEPPNLTLLPKTANRLRKTFGYLGSAGVNRTVTRRFSSALAPAREITRCRPIALLMVNLVVSPGLGLTALQLNGPAR